MMRAVTRVLGTHSRRRSALTTPWHTERGLLQHIGAFATNATPPEDEQVTLPSHIKFRMPDLDFKEVGSGAGETTLTKWYVKEGSEVKDGTHLCEIDTPDLCFQLETGDEGFIARLLVAEGSNNVAPGQPLAIIVPTKAEIAPFINVLNENPRCIEGYVEPTTAEVVSEAEVAAIPTESAASSDVLRMLNKLQKGGHFENENEKALKVLKSLARKNDEQLLTTYKASFEDGVMEEAVFDKDFFVETALELAEEAAGQPVEPNAS